MSKATKSKAKQTHEKNPDTVSSADDTAGSKVVGSEVPSQAKQIDTSESPQIDKGTKKKDKKDKTK